MVIYVKKFVTSCDTNSQGDQLRNKIINHLKKNNKVTVNFSGINNVTTSFINSALISLIDDYDLLTIKERVIIKKVNRQVGDLIRKRFTSMAIGA